MSEEVADTESEPVEGLPAPIELTLFSFIGENMWMGGCPQKELPPMTRFVVSLFPWQPYQVPQGITVLNAWLEDTHEVPEVAELVAIARFISAARRIGTVLVHCQAGLNRSGLVLALAMMVDGASANFAISHLRERRNDWVLCNTTFEQWLREDAAEALKHY